MRKESDVQVSVLSEMHRSLVSTSLLWNHVSRPVLFIPFLSKFWSTGNKKQQDYLTTTSREGGGDITDRSTGGEAVLS
jgi:hypothetical protein